MNNELQKYKMQYKVVKDEFGMAVLKGKIGQIEPYSDKLHQVWVTGIHSGKELSQRKTSSILKKLSPFLTHRVILDGEIIGEFSKENLEKVAGVLKIRKRRVLSAEQKSVLSRRLKGIKE